jgi:hypothetical protein
MNGARPMEIHMKTALMLFLGLLSVAGPAGAIDEATSSAGCRLLGRRRQERAVEEQWMRRAARRDRLSRTVQGAEPGGLQRR